MSAGRSLRHAAVLVDLVTEVVEDGVELPVDEQPTTRSHPDGCLTVVGCLNRCDGLVVDPNTSLATPGPYLPLMADCHSSCHCYADF